MSSRSPHLPDPEDAKALTREGDEARLGTTWHGFPDKRQLPGTNGCNVGQEDTEISGELPGAVKPSRLGVRGSQVRILSSRPISSIRRSLSTQRVSIIESQSALTVRVRHRRSWHRLGTDSGRRSRCGGPRVESPLPVDAGEIRTVPALWRVTCCSCRVPAESAPRTSSNSAGNCACMTGIETKYTR